MKKTSLKALLGSAASSVEEAPNGRAVIYEVRCPGLVVDKDSGRIFLETHQPEVNLDCCILDRDIYEHLEAQGILLTDYAVDRIIDDARKRIEQDLILQYLSTNLDLSTVGDK